MDSEIERVLTAATSKASVSTWSEGKKDILTQMFSLVFCSFLRTKYLSFIYLRGVGGPEESTFCTSRAFPCDRAVHLRLEFKFERAFRMLMVPIVTYIRKLPAIMVRNDVLCRNILRHRRFQNLPVEISSIHQPR